MLFVIAIIGVLISLGLSFAARETDKFKVQKAALQIQHVLQSGMAWYVDNNNAWPAAGKTGDGSTFSKNYVGPQITTDLWGNQAYQYKPETQVPNVTSRFQVIATLPSAQLATRVAALLPVAAATDKVVNAFVSVPGWNYSSSIRFLGEGDFPLEVKYGEKDEDVNSSISLNCRKSKLIFIPYIAGVGVSGLQDTTARHGIKTDSRISYRCDDNISGNGSVCKIHYYLSAGDTTECKINILVHYMAWCF